MSATGWVLAGIVAVAGTAGMFAWSASAVETPDYNVEIVDGAFELRRYPTQVVATVTRDGDRGRAVRNSFRPLANYIFAKSRGGEKIAMTAPVTQVPEKIAMTAPVTQGAAPDGGWTVAFTMPADRTLDDLPQPGGDVSLSEIPPRRVAAVRFSGRWTDANFAAAEERLINWVAAQNLTPIGPAEFAYYNAPFTPFFLRRNEVMIEVAD